MLNESLDVPEAIAPSEADTRLAEESSRRLTRLRNKQPGNFRLRIQADDESEETVAIPASAFRLLHDILTEMAKGNGVTLVPVHSELTTEQAADILNVSQPFLVRLLDEGRIPCVKIGAHRQIQLQDLIEYKRHTEQERLKVLEELAAQAQELDMGY
jgi:excisionase family DNA binding protein